MGERNTVTVGIGKAGSLYYLVSGFLGAYNRRTDALSSASKDISKSILALAQAVGKDDPVLQQKLDAQVAELREVREQLQSTVESNKEKK